MGTSAAQVWFVAGGIPFMLAGGVHALATLRDLFRPMFFAPIERSVMPALQGTGIRFRQLFPGGSGASPSMWRAWLGFNLSHGLGLFTFGLFCLLLGAHDYEVVEEVGGIRPLTIVVSVAYLALSLRFWFYVPTLTIGAGTACLVIAAALSP
jgi:hypothetical protein